MKISFFLLRVKKKHAICSFSFTLPGNTCSCNWWLLRLFEKGYKMGQEMLFKICTIYIIWLQSILTKINSLNGSEWL